MPPPVSVIVASHSRPRWLVRCLTALGQLDYQPFEIVIAADHAGLEAVSGHRLAAHVKTVRCDAPNISRTRNAGITHAAGDFVAFIDDDAVPEPLWLSHHIAALQKTEAHASVGYVRGRNGISFQSRAATIDREGETHNLPFEGDDPGRPDLPEGQALKLVGTNAVVSRRALKDVGGFDPAFRFYLDDSDLSLRLRAAGYDTAIAPLAEVHHAMAPSERRSAHRFPLRLYEIGRSTAIFLRKHDTRDPSAHFQRALGREQHRLTRHMVQGTCEPRDVGRALADFKAGWSGGLTHSGEDILPVPPQPADFKKFPFVEQGHSVFASRFVARQKALKRAAEAIENGCRASVFSFSPTSYRHRVRYDQAGFWEQTGGLFGPSIRGQPIWRWCRFAQRVKEERARVEKQRGIGENGTRVG